MTPPRRPARRPRSRQPTSPRTARRTSSRRTSPPSSPTSATRSSPDLPGRDEPRSVRERHRDRDRHGIILTADGYTLTNRHVVQGSQSLKATLADGSEYPASVVTVSDTQDLALVKIDATGLKPATIGNSDAIKVGQTAIAIGSPLGTFTETVTKGIVSALDRSIQVQDEETGRPVTLNGLIQTDAAINPATAADRC
jgi:S1-C subfamily serine protease